MSGIKTKSMVSENQIRGKLIDAGVKNLHEFGYPKVDKENILTDEVYSGFFRSMLNDNLGHGGKIDNAINQLLSELPKP